MKVAMILGSINDFDKMEPALKILKEYKVELEVRCLSAHRYYKGLSEFVKECNENGTKVIIAGAGMAAALPGVIAAMTVLPVIGVPLTGKTLEGMDALLSIVQMPPGIPVATVAIDGSKNAAYLALEILATSNEELRTKLLEYRIKLEEDSRKANEKLIEKIGESNE